MSLSTDTLLFSIILMLVAVQTALQFNEGSRNFLLAGLGLGILALIGSIIQSIINTDHKVTDKKNQDL